MLTLPYPTSPNNGDPLDATIIQANQTAIAQSIQSFDASQVAAGTISNDASFSAALSPVTRLKETTSNFVSTGLIWSSVSGLQGTMSGGTFYEFGQRIINSGVISYTFTDNQDTYIDIDVNNNLYYVAVANNATTGMTLTANTTRIAKVSSVSGVLNIYQSGVDPLGNIIYPRKPGTKYVDANGWAVYDFGTFREFRITKTATATSWTSSGFFTDLQVNLPVGCVPSSVFLHHASWGNGATANVRINLESNGIDTAGTIGHSFVYAVASGTAASVPLWATYTLRGV